jgi:hypothetical protein
MFTVTGTTAGVGYRVGVQDAVPEGSSDGLVMGSDNVVAMLRAHVGDEVRATPTHEPTILDLEDAESILAFLHQNTAVNAVEGEAPDIFKATPGLIY